ncbi:hypothetical protein [Mucilaginibacter gotjawali]|uniref:Uncharacterized protein n=2 Tax=Mucilaginibacter gotjawali TaxID=1550579 RepID=A0A839S8Q7_9SPHI|nr:hypothetical protein [Mucilaginibacter gotjawali]MBB3053752.1 hypothetical protein [Mucilaginibacter gotjawali]BAU54012.1 hypothetical protein MgSA37_02183 [Mucilaginibacter gotjawali]
MKKFSLIVFSLFHLSICYSQVAYYDANSLSKLLDTNKHFSKTAVKVSMLYTILHKSYGVDSASFIKLQNDPKYNPFLYPFFESANGKTLAETTPILSNNWVSTTENAIGNLPVTNIASGLAGFLVKRAKEELFISIIQKLQDPTKFPEFQILFPKTMALMKNFKAWEYSNVLNTLKAAFEKDLQQLLIDIPQLTTLPNLDTTGMPAVSKKKIDSLYSKAVIKRVNAIRKFLNTADARVLISAMRIGGGIINGEKIPDIIHVVSGDKFLANIPGEKPNVTNAIKFLDILSYSLRSQTKGQNYIPFKEFEAFIADNVSAKLYLGLIYQQMINENIQFTNINISKLEGILNSNGLRTYLDSLVHNGEDLNTAMSGLTAAKKKGEKDLSTYWSAIFQSANGLIQSLSDIKVIDNDFEVPARVDSVFSYSSKTLEVAQDIASNNYSGAIVGIDALIPATGKDNDFKKLFLKYGSFVANLVEAKTAGDAENAIEAVALPVGSYTVKQNSTWNISVNGYVGYGKDGNYASGIYAPIGFSASTSNFWGLCNCQVPLTLFVPIFDVGSIAQYQLNNPTTTGTSTTGTPTGTSTTASTINTSSSNQQIKLGSLFAPGAELLFEYPKWPFAFGAGYRRTPTLSYSSGSTYTTVGARWEVNFTILIDIPIFTLLNRSKD